MLKTRNVFINPDTLSLIVNKQNYGKRIQELYDIQKPVEILGELRFDGPKASGNKTDYYLARIHIGSRTPANIEFLSYSVRQEKATWHPIDSNLTIATARLLTCVHWLPKPYVIEVTENKYAKAVLTKYEEGE